MGKLMGAFLQLFVANDQKNEHHGPCSVTSFEQNQIIAETKLQN
jgi:hypothetical protein